MSKTIGSSAVLQSGTPLTSLWGYNSPGSTVTVELSLGTPLVPPVVAGSDGVWIAAIPALPVIATPFSINVSTAGSPSILLSDMLAGHVILCSGQSNLQLSIQMALNASEEIAALDAYGATVRVYYNDGAASTLPSPDVSTPRIPWSRLSSATAGASSWGGFSATCWYTGRALWRELGSGKVPIGLVESAVGGTAIRQWSPVEALALCPQPYNSPKPYGTAPYQHSTLYNAQIAPYGTGPTQFAAVVWDQAESDSFPQTPPE